MNQAKEKDFMAYKGPQHEIIGFGADDLHEKVTTPTNELAGI